MRESAIEVHGVTKEYSLAGKPVRVLDNVSLNVESGDIVALKGVSGSGKSTLLHILGAVDKPTSGEVRVAGTELSGLSRRGQADFRAGTIGFVFQFFNLMPTLSVAENVASGLEPLHWSRARREQAVEEALRSVRLLRHAGKYPAQLSGGQQQRVAIARALVKKPPIVLADEPTGALDAKTAGRVLDCLGAIQDEDWCTVIIATHDPMVADLCGSVYRIGAAGIERER